MQILGWSHVPSAGDEFREVEDEREARHIAEEREAKTRQAELVTTRRATLQDLLRRSETADVVQLNLIVKADVQGSVQALEDSLLKLPQDEVKVNIVPAGAGGITENDVTLALASEAIIVGFNVRPSPVLASWPRRKASTSAPTRSSTTRSTTSSPRCRGC